MIINHKMEDYHVYPQNLQALGMTAEEYKLASLRYDLWKLHAKGLVEKIPHSHRYPLLPHGYQTLPGIPETL
jgi:hypothetical protein